MSLDWLMRRINLLPYASQTFQYSTDEIPEIRAKVDLKTYVPQPKIYKRPLYTTEIPNAKKKDGETIPRRNMRSKDKLRATPDADTKTVFDILKRSSKKYGNAKALGKRKLIKMHEETKKVKKMVDGKEQEVDKTWQYHELSPYEYLSFSEFEDLALKLGSGFRALGLEKEDRVHLFAATHPYWLAIAHGAASQSMPIVTAYDTLGETGLTHSLQQTHAKLVFLDPHLITKLIKPLQHTKDIQHVIYNDDDSPASKADPDKVAKDVKQLKDAHPHLSICSFSELIKLGEDTPAEPVPPNPEDLCCIMYTSGSTGDPKGVLLTHANVVAGVAGVDTIVGLYLGPGDGLLTYLPLAHILEFVFENACLYWGGTMGYGTVKTISDTSVKHCRGDIAEFKPTVLIGVPAVWETVRKGIMIKVGKMSPILRNMFWGGLNAKQFLMQHAGILPFAGVGTSLVDSVVFKKIQEATGGRLRICMNGGGPIAKETLRFISMCIAPMISGYGLTETTAMGILMDPLAWTDDAMGEIVGSAEMKLVDFADAGYYATNDPPQGEVWIRGASVAKGYLDLDKETKESFTEDGWFKTGDIGEFDNYGQLRIIDRKKNLVKTMNGEYIALEKLESIYRSCPVVNNICVYASQDKSKPIAIVVPVESAIKQIGQDNGTPSDLEHLCGSEKINTIVLREMQNVGRKGGLSGLEIIDGLVLAAEEWTPQNGLVTSAQKLNRRALTQKYQKEIKKAYGG